jgi:cysteine desulfurase / selenocysteine lyase
MTLRPRQVVEAMDRYYLEFPACGERSHHKLGKRVTEEVVKAREQVRRFINARKSEEIIFTKNATESLNTVLQGLVWKQGDVIVSSDREHNSNLLPIQRLKSRGVTHRVVPSLPDSSFDIVAFQKQVQGARLVSIVAVSNLDGYILPVKEIIRIAHKAGALVLLDAAQAAPHQAMDVRDMDADFLAFSGHKMLGPSIGVLYGKKEMLAQIEPLSLGGGTVSDSTYETSTPEQSPERFEAGLQNYAGIIGLSAATQYLQKVGMHKVEQHERSLNMALQKGISEMKGMHLLGPGADK